jgi:hypothetical protein
LWFTVLSKVKGQPDFIITDVESETPTEAEKVARSVVAGAHMIGPENVEIIRIQDQSG